MKLVTMEGKGVTITTTPEIAGRLLKSQVLGLKVISRPFNECEPGGCETCASHKACPLNLGV